MAYFPISSKTGAKQAYSTTTMAKSGLDLRTLPQLLDPSHALIVRNYLMTSDGGLEKRGGLEELFDEAGTVGITLLKKWTDDIYIFGYDTTVSAYRISTDTVTDIKTDFNTTVTGGARYGDYFFVSSLEDPIGEISLTLDYDGQTGNFTVGSIVTGGTSGATAVILEDIDAGATGTLTLGSINGTFQNNEALTDAATGVAVVDGVLDFTYAATAGPNCKIIKVIGNRMYAGCLEADPTLVQYSDVDDGTNPPFGSWTTGTTLADDGGVIYYRNAGEINVIENLGDNIVVGCEEGKWAFVTDTIDSAGTLTRIDRIVAYFEDAGMQAALHSDEGLFYVNSQGLWQLVSIGQNDIKFSDQEVLVSEILGDNYFDDFDFSQADIIKDDKRNQLLITCRNDASANNFVLVYNTQLKAFGTFTGWNINRFLNDDGVIYGASSQSAQVWQIFEGHDDDGTDIWTEFKQELNVGQLWTRKELLGQYAQGKLSQSSSIRIDFNIYDKTGKLVTDKLSLQWTPDVGFVGVTGYGTAPWGAAWGGDVDPLGTIESFAGFKGRIKNFQRVRIHVTEHSQVPHTINWLSVLTKEKVPIRIRNMTQN